MRCGGAPWAQYTSRGYVWQLEKYQGRPAQGETGTWWGNVGGGGPVAYFVGVKLIRRALGAIALAATVASALRLRGRGGTPPQHGGWQPIELDQ